LGVFITGDGDPVRGTLEWPSHPESICMCTAIFFTSPLMSSPSGFDFPYITTLLPNDTIEIHSVETQAIVQVIPASPSDSPTPHSQLGPLRLAAALSGYLVP
jgi:vacuolar protein sorting-associated protein 3